MATIRPAHILVPVAMSPACAWAAVYGSQLARRFGANLSFLHVGTTPRKEVEAFLNRTLKETPQDLTVCEGDPAEVIVQIARERPALWIVMGTHAYGRFRRFLLGSVTSKVLHDVKCPVLTGAHRETIPLPTRADLRRLVCAVDTDTGFPDVIRGALEIKSMLAAELTVVHAIPAADETSDNRGEIEVRKYLFGMATSKLTELKREAAVDVEVTLASGPVATVIREAVLRIDADLVVIGRGHTQQDLGRLRTHAYAIIRSSPCPVLSI